MKKADDVLRYLKVVRSDLIKNYQVATLPKEQLYYETRYIFLNNLIIDIEKIIENQRKN